jgi:dipeptidyl aminopeptidase/acylaminoacyl peptidase
VANQVAMRYQKKVEFIGVKFFMHIITRALLLAAPFYSMSAIAVERPISEFASLPVLENLQLSPNGEKLVAEIAVGGKQRLLILPAGGPGEQTQAGLGDVKLNWVRWVNDEWLIANVTSMQLVGGQEWPLTRLLAFKSDGTGVRTIAARKAAQEGGNVLWIAKDGSTDILLSYQRSILSDQLEFYPQVDRVDVATGKMKMHVGSRLGVFDWYADPNGVVRVGFGREKEGLRKRLLYRNAEGDAFREVANVDSDTELLVPQMFTTEQNTALTFSSKDGYTAVYKLDLNTMQLGDKVFGVKGYDVDRMFTDSSGSVLTGVGYEDKKFRVAWFDKAEKETQNQLDASLPGQSPIVVSSDRAQKKHIVLAGGASNPGVYYLYSSQTGMATQIAPRHATFKASNLGPVKTIQYAARDGLKIEAVLTLPKDKSATNLPLVVLPHGGPSARDSESWDWWTQFLADRGYAVIQPNYRGSTGFGDDFYDKGRGQWGLAMQDDVDDARAWAIAQGIADPSRVCIAGASYGGYVAMRAAERNPELYKCAISYAGVSDLTEMMRKDQFFLYGRVRRAWMKGQAPDFAAVSPIKRPEKFGIPILLMHGKKDRRVDVGQSREMAEKLKAAGKPHEYVEQPEGDHFFSREEDRLQFLQKMEEFLDKHNPA